MEVTLPISSILILAIGFIGVIVSIFSGVFIYVQKRRQHISHYFLVLLLMVCGLTLLNDIIINSGLANRIKSLYFLPICYTLSIGPLFYLFIKTKYNNRMRRIDYLHLVLPVFQAIVYFIIGFRDVPFKSELYANPQFKTFLAIESFAFPIGLLMYSIMSLYILKKPTGKEYFWDNDQRKWLVSFASVFIFITFLELAVAIPEFIFGFRLGNSFFVLRLLFFVLASLWIAYMAIKSLDPKSIYQSRPKENMSEIPKEELNQTIQSIKKLMDEEKIYLNSDLTIKLLAGYVGTTERKCSSALKSEYDSNFNTFINSYRIKAFKEKVDEGKHKQLTLLSMAYECGFESKSTFNRTFKNISGITPTQYIKSLQSQ